MVPWSRIFVLHIYGLRARRYGLWVSQGREFNIEYIARTPLMLPLSPNSYNNCRAAHVLRCLLWKRPSHRFFPTRATGSALDVMDYGQAKAIGISSRPTVRMLFELRIIASGLKLQRLFHRTTSKLHILHAPYSIYSMNNCFLRFCAF